MSGKHMRWRALLPAGLLLLAALACGGFQLRSQATPQPTRSGTPAPAMRAVSPAPSPPPAAETAAPTETAVPTAAPTVVGPGGVGIGTTVRVVATGGINVRDQAGRTSKQVGKLGTGATAKVLEGPVDADGYLWWKIDNGAGLIGWVAGGPANDPWLVAAEGAAAPVTPAASGGGRLVDRAIVVGDRVQVTTKSDQQLVVRNAAGLNNEEVAKSLTGTQFTIVGGPEARDERTWWHVQGEELTGWAVEGDGTARWLTPVEP